MPVNRERRFLSSLPLAKELAEKRRSREIPDSTMDFSKRRPPIPVSDVQRREKAAAVRSKLPPTPVRDFERRDKFPGSQALASLTKERPGTASARSTEAREAAAERILEKHSEQPVDRKALLKEKLNMSDSRRIALAKRLAANRKKS